MPKAKYECTFATDELFRGFRFCYDEDKGFHVRVYEARLPISADMIFADFSTPSGVQVLFAHNGYSQSVGRVTEAKFDKGRLHGVIELSETDLKSVIAGGFEALDAGVNNGLSCGFSFLDWPPTKMEKGEGTAEKPDKVTYGKLEWRELSLTAIPRLKQAGIIRRLEIRDDSEPEPEMVQGDTNAA